MDKLENLIKESFEFQNRQLAKNVKQEDKITALDNSLMKVNFRLAELSKRLEELETARQVQIKINTKLLNEEKAEDNKSEPKKSFWNWFKKNG